MVYNIANKGWIIFLTKTHTNKILQSLMVLSVALVANPVVATTTPSTTTSTPNKPTVDRAAIASCLKAAVTKRETSVGSAFSAYSTAQLNALAIRKDALEQGFSTSSPRDIRVAVNTAWKNYRTTHKTEVRKHNTAVKESWTLYRKEALACKPGKGNISIEVRGP